MKNLNEKHLFISFLLNLIIVIFESAGLVLSVFQYGLGVFQFYTEDSNYFALAISIIYCIGIGYSLCYKKEIPNWIHQLRFISTACLTLTFLMILCVLSPLYPSKFVSWMSLGSGLFQHSLCPILSIISFLLFETQYKLTKKSIFFAFVPTLIYGISCIILNLTKTIEGPYPFFYLYKLPWYISTPWLLGVVAVALLIAWLIYWLHNKSYSKIKSPKHSTASNISNQKEKTANF